MCFSPPPTGLRSMTAFTEAHSLIRERQSPLIADAAKGDSEALSVLLESARPLVHEWATLRTQDQDDAEDVTQMVLLKLYTRLPVFRAEAKLSSWLYRVTLNEVRGLFRKRARERMKILLWSESETQDLSTNSDPDRIDQQRAASVVQEAASTLPPLQLATFRLVDLDGLRPCEAAKALGKTETNIRSSLCRARKKIRKLVRQAQRALSEDMISGGP